MASIEVAPCQSKICLLGIAEARIASVRAFNRFYAQARFYRTKV
jgi:hypothetical protein